ncbi:MAG: UDP-glucose 4-epimerase GalE [Microbacteriaceae bacterium]
MSVLVTGGCGYIGSHVVRALQRRGESVVVVDDLSTGRAERITPLQPECIDLAAASATEQLVRVMREQQVDSVIHFAAQKQVAESVTHPTHYYRENLNSLSNVIDAAHRAGIQPFVFSSSAAVYGDSASVVTEGSATQPMNPYGESKLVGEWLLADSARAFGLAAISLRYFNVAGAGSPELGDEAVMNLVPMVIERIDSNQRPQIFGSDYDTPDGTCIRDYIHVADLAEAHISALDSLRLAGAAGHRVYNVGTGHGSSVKEMVDAIIAVSGASIHPVVLGRRPGDPASIVADTAKIQRELGWSAQFGVREIVDSAWAAHLVQSGQAADRR